MTKELIGQTSTILVSPEGPGVITAIKALAIKPRNANRLRFSGVVQFEESVKFHIERVVLSKVDEILKVLKLELSDYEISVRNIGAASSSDLGVTVAGFSADAPIFLCLLSASLRLAIPEDTTFTGHISSKAGDILPVSSLDKKTEAVMLDENIKKFVYPMLDVDGSMSHLKPYEYAEAQAALRGARGEIKLTEIKDTGELVAKVFSTEALVKAALLNDYFETEIGESKTLSTNSEAAYLTKDNLNRFWLALEENLFYKEPNSAHELINIYIDFYLKLKKYPSGFGKKLSNLVTSLPITVRRNPKLFQLLNKAVFIKIIQYATELDHEDVSLLHNSLYGKFRIIKKEKPSDSVEDNIPSDHNQVLKYLLEKLDPEYIETNITRPFDEARARYSLSEITLESHEEFLDILSAFYKYLLLHTSMLQKPLDKSSTTNEALDICEKTFREEKGFKGALAEARHATHGGLRYILDRITEYLKQEACEKHVLKTFKKNIDPLDFRIKTALVTELIKMGQEHLPDEIISQPPERFAENYEEIIAVYAKSKNALAALLNRL